MLPLILSAALVSFAGAVAPGPMLAVTIAKGVRFPWAGLQIALGHTVIDILITLLIYFGLSQFLQVFPAQIVLNLLGGILLVWLGVRIFRSGRL